MMNGAEVGSLNAVRKLLERGGDPNLRGRYEGSVMLESCEATALALAAKNGHAEIVMTLLDWWVHRSS